MSILYKILGGVIEQMCSFLGRETKAFENQFGFMPNMSIWFYASYVNNENHLFPGALDRGIER